MLPSLVTYSPAEPYCQVKAIAVGCNDCVLVDLKQKKKKKKKACLIGVYFQVELCYNIAK